MSYETTANEEILRGMEDILEVVLIKLRIVVVADSLKSVGLIKGSKCYLVYRAVKRSSTDLAFWEVQPVVVPFLSYLTLNDLKTDLEIIEDYRN